jgi:hypothetical protein
MPAIQGYEITQLTTEFSSIQLELPTHQVGDLLLAFVGKDVSSSGNWTITSASNWTIGGQGNDGIGSSCVWGYKIASSSAEVLPVFQQSGIDSILGIAICVRGVHQSSPIDNSNGNGMNNRSIVTRGVISSPGIITNYNNSLVFYTVVESDGLGPTPYPGIQRIMSDDTATVGLSVGWTFAPTATTVPSHSFYIAGVPLSGSSFAVAVRDDTSGSYKPAYHNLDVSMSYDLNPLTGTAYPVSGSWGTALTISTIGSKTTVFDAIGNTADSGVNPFHASSGLTPAITSNLGGTQFNIPTASYWNVTNGIIIGSHMYATPRDYIDCGFVKTGGTQVVLADPQNGYKSWMIAAQRAKTTFPDYRNYYAFQPNATVFTGFATSSVAMTLTQINKIMCLTTCPLGNAADRFSQFVLANVVNVVGGSSTYPISFSDFIGTLNGYVMPFARLQGDGASLIYVPVVIGDKNKATQMEMKNFAIQFPRIAVSQSGYLDYHADSNFAGITFMSKAGDSIKVQDSIIQSSSPWRFEFSSSLNTSSVWNFSGLTVIGGTPTLRNIGTASDAGFYNMSFIDCDVVKQNGATITSCIIQTTTHESSSLQSNNPSLISYCNFISDGTKHGIEVTVTGSYTFAGNTFTNFGASGSTSASLYNKSGGYLSLNIVNGGDIPTYRNGPGATTEISASITHTLTGIISGSEVTYVSKSESDAPIEIYHVESVGVGGTTSYTYNYEYDRTVNIYISNLGYQWLNLEDLTLSNSNVSIPVQQQEDLYYYNPT